MKTDQTHPISHKNKNIDGIFSFRKKIAYKRDRQNNILGSSAVLNRKLKEKKRNHSLPEEIALVQQKKKKKNIRRQSEEWRDGYVRKGEEGSAKSVQRLQIIERLLFHTNNDNNTVHRGFKCISIIFFFPLPFLASVQNVRFRPKPSVKNTANDAYRVTLRARDKKNRSVPSEKRNDNNFEP